MDMGALAARAADLYREVAEQKRIRVVLDIPGPAPMQGDPVRIGQALSNLVDNALKYTPEGGTVTLSTGATADLVTVTITDTGPGVPAEEQDAVWRRLYRGDASRSQRGLGLGLTLVRAVAEAHGGSAAVSDAPGGGARFQMRFPLV
jgi:signal transduction histidine kinase